VSALPAISGLLPDAICFLSVLVHKFEETLHYRAVPGKISIRKYFNKKKRLFEDSV